MNKWINKKILQADLLGFSLSLWKSQIFCIVKSKSNFHIRKTTNKKSVDHAVIIGVENLCFFFCFKWPENFPSFVLFSICFFFLMHLRYDFIIAVCCGRPQYDNNENIISHGGDSFKRNAMCDQTAEKEKPFNLSSVFLFSSSSCLLFLIQFVHSVVCVCFRFPPENQVKAWPKFM